MHKEEHLFSYEVLAENEVQKPKFFAVILLNDDFTPMDFVVCILCTVFHKPHETSYALMMEVHIKGKASCGIFTYDIAETKRLKVQEYAEKEGHPLTCILEEINA